MKLEFSRHTLISEKYLNIKLRENRTGTTELIVAFRSFEKAPKN